MLFNPRVTSFAASQPGEELATVGVAPIPGADSAPPPARGRTRTRSRSRSGSPGASATAGEARRERRRQRGRARAAALAASEAARQEALRRREVAAAVASGARERAQARAAQADAAWAENRRAIDLQRGRAPGRRAEPAERLLLRVGLEIAASPYLDFQPDAEAAPGAAVARPSSTPARPSAAPTPGSALGIFQHAGVWVTATQTSTGRPGLPAPVRPTRAPLVGYFV